MWLPTRKFIERNSGILIIVILSLILKLLYLFIYQGLPAWDQLTVDNYYHHNWALDIADGNVLGDTTYFRAPLYVYCLGLLYSVLGASLWVGRLFGLVVGILSLVMTYRIAGRVFGHRVALVAASIQMLYPAHLYFDAELLLDPLFTLLLQWAVYRALIWWDTRKPRDIFIAGLVIGMAAITRPTAAIIIPLIGLLALALLGRFRVVLLHLGLLALGALLVILPITARNILKADDPVLIASQGGINLFLGNNDSANGISATMPEPMGLNWRISQITHIAESELGHSLKPGEVSSFWFDKSVDWILKNPGRFLKLYAKKLYWNFSDREVSNNRNLAVFFRRMPLLRYNPLSFGILFALTILGAALFFNENRKGAFLITMIMTFSMIAALFFFSSRFRLPLLPYYIILASASLCWLLKRLFDNARRILRPLASVLIAGLFSFYPLISFPPGDPSQHLVSEGLYYLTTQRYDLALSTLRKARTIDPSFPETNLNIGAAFIRLGQLDSALYYLNEEKRYHPNRDKADVNIASIYLLRGQVEGAVETVQKSIRVRPWDPLANMILLRALFMDSAMTVEALLDSVNAAATRTGNDIYVLNDAAVRFSAKGYLDEAAVVLGRAVVATAPAIETDDHAFERDYRNSRTNWNSEKAQANYQLGYISGLKGEIRQSITYSSRAIELDSTLAEAYVNLINAYLLSGQTEQARRTLAMAAARFADNVHIKQLQLNLQQ